MTPFIGFSYKSNSQRLEHPVLELIPNNVHSIYQTIWSSLNISKIKELKDYF
jgi:hypothetical protein